MRCRLMASTKRSASELERRVKYVEACIFASDDGEPAPRDPDLPENNPGTYAEGSLEWVVRNPELYPEQYARAVKNGWIVPVEDTHHE